MFRKHKKEILLSVVVIALFLLFWGRVALAGGGFTIPWWTLDGGGGLSQGGNFAVNGTLGQSDAGFISGGQFTLYGGFWDVSEAVVSPPDDFVFLPLVVH